MPILFPWFFSPVFVLKYVIRIL